MPTYVGKICIKHPELGGKRPNGNCPEREREKPRRKTATDVNLRRLPAILALVLAFVDRVDDVG